ncbi:MAG: aldehyde dehydrogenase family protein, partial [Flavobacteriales bacterium]|nr:aldehyde dehydrogenase family protein [Flavobacteriales bacterium]
MTTTPQHLEHYLCNQWVSSSKLAIDSTALLHAVHGNVVARLNEDLVDVESAMDYARSVGNINLRNLTFQERGRMLKALALHLHSKKEKFYEISWATGATRNDSWIDIEGGIGNLFSYASLRKQFGDTPFALDGLGIPLSKEGSFVGHHVLVPKQGVAIHINAFNFPIWGMLEKVAVNWLAGVPAIVKPASAT